MKYLFTIIIYSLLQGFKQTNEGTLTVNTSNFNNDIGNAVLFIFRKSDDIPQSPFKVLNTTIINKKANFLIHQFTL